MFPSASASPYGNAAAASGMSPHHLRRTPLPPPQSRALMIDLQEICSQAQSLIRHLQSNDPAAQFSQQDSEALLAQCHQLADCMFLADAAPALTTGVITRNAIGAPPQLTEHHQGIIQGKREQLNQLIHKLQHHASVQLDQSCQYLQENVQRARDEAALLGTPCQLPACDRATELLLRVRQRHGESELERCSIAKQARMVRNHDGDISMTLQRLHSLNALREGFEGSPPFSHEDHESFHQSWLQAVDAMGREMDPAHWRLLERTLYDQRLQLMKTTDPTWTPKQI